MNIYRMYRSARAAADYTGAMLAGGRWNPIGTPMLYTAQYLSLACIEVLVHLDKSQLPRDYVWSRTSLPNTPGTLPCGNLTRIASCQAAGHAWVSAGDQLAIQVPSIVIPEEFNILLNPNHTGCANLVWSEPRPFRFDPRLFIVEPQTGISRPKIATPAVVDAGGDSSSLVAKGS
jgi:RES domain-containing protein